MSSTSRLLSLDVFRGMTIALMILVNSPGNNTAYAWLNHSVWNGCTITDLVFPFFVFIVGVSLAFSLSKQVTLGVPKYQLLAKIARRALLIFLLGLFLNAFPNHFDFSELRIFGVLQRIAICYFVAACIFLTCSAALQVILTVILLAGYAFIITLGDLTLEGNIVGYVDRLFFSSAQLYEKIFDPEGILSTLPAIATALIGNLIGIWLMSDYQQKQKWCGMLFFAALFMMLGWIWSIWLPINKALWTSSYVLWSAGLALLLLSICYWLIEIRGWKKWSKPFEIFGLNAITAYFLHIFFLKIQAMIHLSLASGKVVNLRLYITDHLFGWASAKNASLMYAVCYVLLWLILLTVMYRKKIFIRF